MVGGGIRVRLDRAGVNEPAGAQTAETQGPIPLAGDRREHLVVMDKSA